MYRFLLQAGKVDGYTAHDTFHVPLVDFGDMRQGDPLVDPDTGQLEQRWFAKEIGKGIKAVYRTDRVNRVPIIE